MFRRKKNTSRDSAASRDSFAGSRDSSAVASPSAGSDAGSGLNTSALFVNDYRNDQRRLDHSGPQAQTPTSVQQAYAPAPQTFQNIQPRDSNGVRLPLNSSVAPKLDGYSSELEQQNRLLLSRLTELKSKRDALLHETREEEEEQKKFEEHVILLKQRLVDVTQVLHSQRERCGALEKLIDETEAGYVKLVETSKMILGLLQNEPFPQA